jgi:hypothetical protein
MQRQIQEIQYLATKYSKAALGRMVQLGLLDPQKAMMAGMMIQRIEQQNAKPPQTTVAQEVLGLPTVAMGPQSQPSQVGPSPAPTTSPPVMTAADGGLLNIPAGDVGEYAGGGIVAFDDGGEVEGYAKGDLVPSGLFEALVQAESRGRHSAVSSKGARGAAQLMPGTMRDPGYGIKPVQDESLGENLRVGREYLGVMLKKYGGNVDHALAAYNWGPGNVDKWLRRGGDPSELPRETKTYIPRVKNFMAQQRQESAPIRVAERPQMDEAGLAGIPAGQFIPVRDRVGMPSLLRRPLERVTRLLPSAGAGGIEDLPAGMQPRAEYASGGIVAFDEGGYVPRYAGNPEDGSLVGGYPETGTSFLSALSEKDRADYAAGKYTTSPVGRFFAPLTDKLFGASYTPDTRNALIDIDKQYNALFQQRRELTGAFGLKGQTPEQRAQVVQIDKQMADLSAKAKALRSSPTATVRGATEAGIGPAPKSVSPGAETPKAATTGNFGAYNIPEDQFPLSSFPELLARRQQGVGYTDDRSGKIVRPGEAPPAPVTEGKPAPEAPAASKITRPELSNLSFEDYIARATPKVGTLNLTKEKSLKEVGDERRKAEAAAGYDEGVFNKMIDKIEKKKGTAASEKDIAFGQFLMTTGFEVFGAREGEEFEKLGKGGQKGLLNYQEAMKDLKARQEKYDERIESLRMADLQARRTGLDSDIRRRDSLAEQAQADRRAVFQAENNAANAGVNAAANLTVAQQNNLMQLYNIDKRDELGREELKLRGREVDLRSRQLDVTSNYYEGLIKAQENRNKALGANAQAKYLAAKQKIMDGMSSDPRYAAFVKDLKSRYGDNWANIVKAQTEFSNFQKMYLGQKLEAMGELDLDMSGIKHESEF